MRNKVLLILTLAAITFMAGCANQPKIETVLLPVKEDPTVAFRVLFNVGSMNDPAGKEGLAAITATMLVEGSTKNYTYEQVLEKLYPMASSIGEQVDKEMTVFYGRAHKDNVQEYYGLLKEVLLNPAFKQEDFDRVKVDYLNYVQNSLRYSQDEELGKEVLYEYIFDGTPYSHNEEGYVQSLNAITIEDVKAFYTENYTQSNLVFGLGGGYSSELLSDIKADFLTLPKGVDAKKMVVTPAEIDGMNVKIINKDNAASTAISFGFPINVLRGDKDFYALALATSWLGEHRNSSSHLFQVIRDRRGLNYGDYAYIEHFPRGYARQYPPSNVARSQQIFQIWIRPVPNEARVFAYRAALRELEKLVENGMTEETFELTRKFLKNYNLHYAPTTMQKLGYALDDHYYGIKKGHWNLYADALNTLTLTEVNSALKKHFNYKNLKAVFITPDAEGLKNDLVNNSPSPITYGSPKPPEILEEDKEIIIYPLSVASDNVVIKTVDSIFEGTVAE